MGKRGLKPKGKVEIKWSSNFAYAIGLLATDGYVSNDFRHIVLVSKDIEQLKNFCKAINIVCFIGKYKSGSGNFAYRVQLTDTLFHSFLTSIGIFPAKSLTISSVNVPDEYFFDFLRGCFDGDGCTYSYWDQRWKSSFMFYVGFASGSQKFISWMQNKISHLSGLNGHVSVHKKKGAKNEYYQLRFSKYEALKLVGVMFSNEKCIKLTRKYLKIKESLDTVHRHKGRVFVR